MTCYYLSLAMQCLFAVSFWIKQLCPCRLPTEGAGAGIACKLSSMDNQASQGRAGLANSVGFKLMFLIAAIDVFCGGVLAVVINIIRPRPAIFTFTSELFLVFFGFVMLVLDAPAPSARFAAIKDEIYKKLLFLTRFTGRGFWYMYLGTMIWAALWDQNLNKVLGFIMALYPIILGIVAVAKGISLSLRLEKVRKAALSNNAKARIESCENKKMDKAEFSNFCQQFGNQNFDDHDLEYLINGLSLTARNDGKIDMKEWNAWLSGTPQDSLLQLI